MSRGKDATIAAAAELFAERGYSDVTIRDIASRAKVSPAMVIKYFGSKQDLFDAVATMKPFSLPEVPDAELGEALVRGLFDRLHTNSVEPMTRALLLLLTAPSPEAVRKNFAAEYFGPLTEHLGGDNYARLRAELIVGALIGLAMTVRIFALSTITNHPHEAQHRYGTIVQQLLNG